MVSPAARESTDSVAQCAPIMEPDFDRQRKLALESGWQDLISPVQISPAATDPGGQRLRGRRGRGRRDRHGGARQRHTLAGRTESNIPNWPAKLISFFCPGPSFLKLALKLSLIKLLQTQFKHFNFFPRHTPCLFRSFLCRPCSSSLPPCLLVVMTPDLQIPEIRVSHLKYLS